jgi:hypothetical protein
MVRPGVGQKVKKRRLKAEIAAIDCVGIQYLYAAFAGASISHERMSAI